MIEQSEMMICNTFLISSALHIKGHLEALLRIVIHYFFKLVGQIKEEIREVFDEFEGDVLESVEHNRTTKRKQVN